MDETPCVKLFGGRLFFLGDSEMKNTWMKGSLALLALIIFVSLVEIESVELDPV
jgi:hypothetical protein